VKRKVRILQVDIRKGTQEDPNWCAVALGCRREFKQELGTAGGVYVLDTINIGERVFLMPKKVTNWITRFDESKSSVKPFSFCLDY
jgi:hypothetical protein